MIPRECKRLAEVEFPIAAISQHAADEKSRGRGGHPSTLHPWWARRPLTSSRAMLLALLFPDPCDPNCPEKFKQVARKLLPSLSCGPVETDQDLRSGLLKFIVFFSNWNDDKKYTYLNQGRQLIEAAHGSEPPLVVDPFAGGGSIPLEALRIGCDAFASDLNPVACLILKVMLEDIPRYGSELTNELTQAGNEINDKVKQELASLYPCDSDGAIPIAYLWARTVRCEAPDCGAEIPLMRSLWLCKKPNRKWALRYTVKRTSGKSPHVVFDIFEPKTEKDVKNGSVTRARATCFCCGSVLPPKRVQVQIANQCGGADAIFDENGKRRGGAYLTAVVTIKNNQSGRHYRLATDADYEAVYKAQEQVSRIIKKWKYNKNEELCPIPDETLPPIGTLGINVQNYGVLRWGDLYTARQKVALVELTKLIQLTENHSVNSLLSCALSRCASHWSSGARWNVETVAHTFARPALPMTWDFVEACGFGNDGTTWERQVGWVKKVVEAVSQSRTGTVENSDATDHPLPDQSASVWFTDPPYYDAVPYADLSDYFFVWLKRSLQEKELMQDHFDSNNPLSPKSREAVQDKSKHHDGIPKNREWYEKTMAQAFFEGHRVLADNGIGSVVFAHKSTEGWEALLSGIMRGNWIITGSWPIATEKKTRLRAIDSAALATSVHLVCRPRPQDAGVGEWADVLCELPQRVADWMDRLQNEGVRGADLVFACIGPAFEIFSRYRTVETAEGLTVSLSKFLEKVWETVGREALKRVLETEKNTIQSQITGVFEEDARLTALFLWTLQSSEDFKNNNLTDRNVPSDAIEGGIARATAKGFNLPFDVVRRFAQPMGIDLDRWTGRIIVQNKGIVRLLPIAERAKELLGIDFTQSRVDWFVTSMDDYVQSTVFPDDDSSPGDRRFSPSEKFSLESDQHLQSSSWTVLDRVHLAMTFQACGYSGALRKLIDAEQKRSVDFIHLANALSALYPSGCEEKRLLDAMLLAVPK